MGINLAFPSIMAVLSIQSSQNIKDIKKQPYTHSSSLRHGSIG